jgi:hypothetical protein
LFCHNDFRIQLAPCILLSDHGHRRLQPSLL